MYVSIPLAALCSNGRYLVSGSTDGHVCGWDVLSEVGGASQHSSEDLLLDPLLHHQTHSDAVNGIR